jgi:putative RecB family exonuclease
MPRRLYSCTPTRLGNWLDCPRRYRMTYLDRPPPQKGPPWAHNSLGASVHNALAGWWRLPRQERTVAAAGRLLRTGWLGDGFASDAQSAEYRDYCQALVEGYVAGLDPDREPVGVERTVATRTERIAVSGRIDRLDDRPAGATGFGVPGDADGDPGEDGDTGADAAGGLVVVDYKTGRYVPDQDDARSSLALALYALAAERVMRRPCRRVELHHIPTGTVAAWEHTPESLARQLGRAEDIAAECAAADARYADTPRAAAPRVPAQRAESAAGGASAANARDARAPVGPAASGGGAEAAGGEAARGGAEDGQAARAEAADGEAARGGAASGGDAEAARGRAAANGDAFEPSPGPQCGWCDFRAHCPEGSAAAERRRPWDGLALIDAGAAIDARASIGTASAR